MCIGVGEHGRHLSVIWRNIETVKMDVNNVLNESTVAKYTYIFPSMYTPDTLS